MSTGKFFLFQSLVYSSLLFVVFFNRQRLKTKENRIYSMMIIVSLIELSTEILLDYIGPLYNVVPPLSYTIARVYLLLLLFWIITFTFYIITVALKLKNKEELGVKIKQSFIFIYILLSFLIIVLPIYFHYEANIAYTYGASVYIVYIASFIFSIVSSAFLIWNYKNFKDKRFLPLIVFLVLGSICSVVQYIYPGLLLATAVHVFITFLMFFTIENPDLNLVKEYKDAKDYAESSNSSKELFMNTGSKTIKELVKVVDNMCDEINEYDDINDIKEVVNEIKSYTNQSLSKLTKILDFSSVEVSDVKVLNNKYNPNLLFEQLTLYIKNTIEKSNRKIEFIEDVDRNLPDTLYGDSIRIKEIIKNIIDSSTNNINNKFIELTVNYINKDNLCRLLITIEDSMPEQFNTNFNEYQIDENNLSDDEKNLLTLKALVNKIGGTLMITNTQAGRKFVVVLDQKISIEKHEDKLEAYTKEYIESENKKRIIIVYNDKNKADKLALKIKKYKINIDVVSMGQTCLEKIRANEKYDLIILDDNLPKLSSTRVLEKLKEIENFNTPVVLLLKNKNTELEDRYINIGFSECIIKPLDNKEINSLVNKYLMK